MRPNDRLVEMQGGSVVEEIPRRLSPAVSVIPPIQSWVGVIDVRPYRMASPPKAKNNMIRNTPDEGGKSPQADPSPYNGF